MSNSKLVNYTDLTTHYGSRNGTKIDRITLHHMAGNLAVEACGNVFKTREASSNYGIDNDERVGLYVDESNRAWSTANPSNDRRAVNIELANDSGAPDWHVSDKVINKCIELCADICKRNGILKLSYDGTENGNLTVHNMFISTTCPGPYLQSKLSYIADEVNKKLENSDDRTPPVEGITATIQNTLNSRYGYNIVVDNIYGPDTHKHMVKALQHEFNIQLGSKIAEDGIFGPRTKSSCPVLRSGMKGNITWLVQSMLVIKGYKLDKYGMDSVYGNETINAIKKFQSTAKLSVDGLCGKNTFEKLFS
ncbi:MAG: N-acetylmuramoyl-L-alanine amidase [Bacilli bacterium]|nr:N-acetylmuramoyl-L-alanine amidase [Bacilli bacterium]MBP3635554.1 N-acetylmuramoyl-L-alanine amidase [Bacilli bacterium]